LILLWFNKLCFPKCVHNVDPFRCATIQTSL
jgi:hypothetical protein